MGTIFSTIVMLVFLAFGIHVAGALFIVGFAGAWAAIGTSIVNDFGNQVWLALNNFALTSIPLFILLGEFLLRSDITDKMYHSLSLWLSRLPGGLLHTNIGACALMAATSGSSVATAATLGVVAIPTMMAKGYNERMLLGSVCAGGTLGILIPPSINMIIYGSISNTSIGKLFIAGVVPGILLAVSFSMVIAVFAIIKPSWVGGAVEPKTSFMDKLRTIPAFLPAVVIVFAIMGSIYLGWATPTEAAALGVFVTLIMALIKKKVTIKFLHDSPDHGGRLLSELRDLNPRSSPALHGVVYEFPVFAPGSGVHDHAAVHHPGDVYRNDRDDGHHDPPCITRCRGCRIRPDLVRDIPGRPVRGLPDHAAGRHEPLCGSGDTDIDRADDGYRDRDDAVFGDDVSAHGCLDLLSPTGHLASGVYDGIAT